MKSTFKILFLTWFFVAYAASAQLQQVGEDPIPVFKNVTVQTAATYDASANLYTYTYTVTNPASNTGRIWDIEVDMQAPPNYINTTGSQLTMPDGKAGDKTFDAMVQQITPPQSLLPDKTKTIAFGIQVPSSWDSMITVGHTGGFAANSTDDEIKPGETFGGLKMISRGLPTIKTMELHPYWNLVVNTEEATEQQEIAAEQVQEQLIVEVPVLAPSWVLPGSFDQWDELKHDLARAIRLGWVSDAALGQTLTNQLQAARTARKNGGNDQAVVDALHAMLSTLAAANGSQLNEEARELVALNAQAMLNEIGPLPQPPNPPPPAPSVSFVKPTDQGVQLIVGQKVTITARVVDKTHDDAPMSDYIASIYVASGPDAGLSTNAPTDANGEVSLTFAGKGKGLDVVLVDLVGPAATTTLTPKIRVIPTGNDQRRILWQAGADLTIGIFTPPIIMWDGHTPIHFTDITQNIGAASAPASTTQYYLSKTQPVDPKTAILVGSRPVPALAPGEQSFHTMTKTLPAKGGAGVYYLKACANGDHAVIETDYSNNCNARQIVTAMQPLPRPDCSHAAATVTSLWPPNHKLRQVAITGVTDPNGFPVTITIMRIQQDEPVQEPGSGNTEPDATGIGTATASLRAERSGGGTGRIYFLSFQAENGHGGICKKTVMTYVPHDQGQATVPVDTGERFDSTQ